MPSSPREPGSNPRALQVSTFLGATFFSHVFLVPGVAVSDLLLLACAAGAGLLAWRLRQRPEWPSWATWLALFWAWALLGGFLRSLSTPFGFSQLEFAKSFTKLTFYGAASVLIAWSLKRVEPEKLREAFLTLLALNAALALLLYAAMTLWPELPIGRFLPGGSQSAAYYFELRWFGDRSPESLVRHVYLRTRGLSTEPSHLGYVQAMGLGFLMLGGRPPRFGLRFTAVLASILLTFSLTAYALLMAVLLLASPRLVAATSGQRRSMLWVGAALCTVLLLPPVAQTLYRAVVVRGSRLLQGRGDSSARLRLVDSWLMAFHMARAAPVLGTGLGNFEQGVATVKEDLEDRELLGPETQGWNVLAHVLGVTGAVGLSLFLIFLAQLVPGRGALATLFFLGCMVQGSFLAAPFWVFWVTFGRDAWGGPRSPSE